MAKPKTAFNWAMGCVLAVATAAGAAPPVWLGASWSIGQTPEVPDNPHIVLNNAIECYRQGNYEKASGLLLQAQVSQNELRPNELNDLNNHLRLNANALHARQEGSHQVDAAEAALRAGRTQEAATLLKALNANQYLAPADQLVVKQLTEQLGAGPATVGFRGTGAEVVPASGKAGDPASIKLREARALLARGDYQGATSAAYEAVKLRSTYEEGEDSPDKVLADVEKAKAQGGPAASRLPADAKSLLVAARTALQQGDLDRAEQLVGRAEQAAAKERGTLPCWLHPWSDTPAKVRRDIQAARDRKKTAPVPHSPPSATAPEAHSADRSPRKNLSPFDNIKNLFTRSEAGSKTVKPDPNDPKPETAGTVIATSDTGPAPEPTSGTNMVARQLLQAGRKALGDGNLDRAREDAEKARNLHPDLNWWEDNPDKLTADIHRVESARAGSTGADAKAADSAMAHAGKDRDPRALLKEGRDLYAQGKLDDAEKRAHQAATVAKTSWGLFEDSPDKLHYDIQKARVKRDQEQSVHVLAEARKLFAEGKLKEAKSKAFLAQKLHGPYSMWDLGDRPQKLISEIEAVEHQNRKIKVPAPSTALVKTTDPNPKPATGADARAAQANEWLAAARSRLGEGNVPAAAEYAERVRRLDAGWDLGTQGVPPWSESLFVLERDIQAASHPVQPSAPILQAQATTPEAGPPVVRPDQAKLLLSEARRLQRDGRLVEARQKAVEAQQLGATFAEDEDRPEVALLELAALADRKVSNLLAHATDCVTASGGNAQKFQIAEADLRQAKTLSEGFGLDSLRVDHQLAWLEETREAVLAHRFTLAGSPDAPARTADNQAPKGTEQVTPRDQGLQLLDKARLELRHGQTSLARRLAVEAYTTDAYGVRAEAEKVLRSIDIEEFNQDILAANRTADAGFAAFNRHDYAHASRVLASIDVKKLSPERATRLREIMSSVEMRPTVVAQNSQPGDIVRVSEPASLPKMPVPSSAGKATVTDLAPEGQPGGDGLLARQVGIQEVKFQELHTQGRQVQRDAMERFKAGDTDRALEMLNDLAQKFEDSGLDPARIAALKAPIMDRLQRLKTLKAQRDFERGQVAQNVSHHDIERHKAQAEQQKRDKVAELMKQYNTLYREGKYHEANMMAMKALEVDSDNVAASAAVQISKMAERHQVDDRVRGSREQMFWQTMEDAEDMGPAVNSGDPLKVDPKITERSRKRSYLGTGIMSPTKNLRERQIERQLSMPVSLNFKDTKLEQVIDDMRDITGVNVVADTQALNEASVNLDQPLTLKVDNISLKSALSILLRQVNLTYLIKDEALQITTKENAKGKLKRVTYPVADLVVPIENNILPKSADINTFFGSKYDTTPQTVAPIPYTGPFALQTGSPVSSPGSGVATMVLPSSNAAGSVHRQGQTIEDLLIKLITSTIEPESWSDVGGQGTIQYFPLGMALIVNQTLTIQEDVADLLEALRRLQDLEVAIEMRLVSVSESFFERIGVNFDVNIVNSNHKFDNNLLTTNFQPFGFINKFTPSGFAAGLTPAGTFTPDLGWPIRQSSFALATPPFGYPYAVGSDGGLSLGLAFLSDIQVFMFMEAAQGDRRVNVMQAPKLTMFNGQSATLQVQEFQFFMTSVQPAFTGAGQLYFIPQNQPVPLGVQLTVQPVVSGDRRFVRMNLNPQLTNLANANVPLMPIQIPIPQVFETGIAATGQDRLFQIFLQQPTFSQIAIQTTVSVPDGGTVLLGGLKTLSEGRSEFGPPILSKIPYINRLFKNVGYGKEAQSLLIMVTPRIIINLEEEIRQTGGPGGVAAPPP
jgi:type II secretory pathway component GspD/PulD (secretin)